jgi:hypothetical protein
MVGREFREFKTDLLERQPDALGEDDEGDAAKYGARKAAMARAGSLGGNEPSLLVKAQGGGGDAAPARDLTDSQQVGCGHRVSPSEKGFDFKFSLTCKLRSHHPIPQEEAVMSSRQRASEWITETVTAWPGVNAGPGRRGEFAFTVGGREIGHLHGDHSAHFAFPKSVWVDLKAQGRIDDHPVFPGRQGLGARRIESESDIEDVIALLRINYDRVVAGAREPVDTAA